VPAGGGGRAGRVEAGRVRPAKLLEALK
jgi:hypothetical protein